MKCSNCGKTLGYMRINTGEWVCRTCGRIEKVLTAEDKIKNFIGVNK